MKLPFYKTVSKSFKNSNKLEIGFLYYLIISIIIHLFYVHYLSKSNFIYEQYYVDKILFTIPNFIIIVLEFITRLINLMLTSSSSIIIFEFVLKYIVLFFKEIDSILLSIKYLNVVYKNITWFYLYIALLFIVIAIIIKKIFKVTFRIALILLVIYILYSLYLNYI